jgi:hypothetical protein
MLILRGTASSTYNAINRTVFWNADIIVVLPIAEARAKADDITVTGVLTCFWSICRKPFKTKLLQWTKVHGAWIQNRRFCYCYRNKKHFTGQVQISPVKYYLKWGGYQPIQPKTITLNELVNHPAELVRVNTTFPNQAIYIW